MTKNELGLILREMYDGAPQGYQVANIHLFGIKYASIIHSNNYKSTEIVSVAGLKPSYSTEVSKGIKLSRYVMPK